ncbi:MAG: NapC/NirT family cytochrome c [Ignavibacteriaceae bacterium]|nr:NapC/NirT family cytochrome c [Ignavibacteriaceae bacterium]
MKRRFPTSVYNPISMGGAIIAAISFGLILFLMVLEATSKVHKPYMGIIAFVILPSFLIGGLLLIAFGMWREHKRRLRGEKERKKFPTIDLNDPRHLAAVSVFTVGTVLLLVFSAFGSFKAYEYTDSDEFCGTVCHTVMEPEYTAYQHSPHSKVGCVKCHIGEGADWFVRAKISGSYQLYSVMFNKYSRPIPTPIANLRPAQETCEQCHWPKHFFGEKKVTLNYYLPDEKNNKSSLTMLLRVGGGQSAHGLQEGIHWHMNIANDIYYASTDESRQVIEWVKSINKETGEETIYRLKDKNVPTPPEDKIRKMDCIDCHNRPAHIYKEPRRMVNLQMEMGEIDTSLPFIKSVSVQALEGEYKTKDEAQKGIGTFITNFYKANYPDLAVSRSKDINKAIKAVRELYAVNYFPEMKVSWRHYPNNLGHLNYDGCYRCHDGKHVSSTGKKITNDCNSCHILLAQKIPGKPEQISLSGLKFEHPGGISISLENQKCSDCHGIPYKVIKEE